MSKLELITQIVIIIITNYMAIWHFKLGGASLLWKETEQMFLVYKRDTGTSCPRILMELSFILRTRDNIPAQTYARKNQVPWKS